MNGGIVVTIFNPQLQENSERLRNDFGMISERLRKPLSPRFQRGVNGKTFLT